MSSNATADIMPSHGIPHSKAPDMSQISCLSACNEPVDYQPTQKFRDHTPEFVRIAKAGGHKDLLTFEPNTPGSEPVQYDRKSEWYYQEGVDPSDSFNGKEFDTPDDAKVKRPTNKHRVRQEDSDYVKLAKKGGHSDLLVIEENQRSSLPKGYQRSADWYYLEDNKGQSAPSYTRQKGQGSSNPAFSKLDSVDGSTPQKQSSQSNYTASQPIWLGGSGPEISHVPGKRFIKKEQTEAPFAMHSSSSATRMSRNPDKI